MKYDVRREFFDFVSESGLAALLKNSGSFCVMRQAFQIYKTKQSAY